MATGPDADGGSSYAVTTCREIARTQITVQMSLSAVATDLVGSQPVFSAVRTYLRHHAARKGGRACRPLPLFQNSSDVL